MIPVRIAGVLSFAFGAYIGILGVADAESRVGRIDTAILGNLSQVAAERFVGGMALIIVGIMMMVWNVRRDKA